MRTRLYNLWEKLRTTFWLVPALMVSITLATLVGLLNLDQNSQLNISKFVSFLEQLSPSGARVILSTIAGSMITVAGTVFSITIVTLTLASNQFGPKLLRNFMQSTVNQVVLGSFISTFVYCLCALGTIEPAGKVGYVPSLSVNFAVVLAMFNVGILIYFIHHVSTSIQVETVLSSVNKALISSIEDYFPERSSESDSNAKGRGEETLVSTTSGNSETVTATGYGYLQAIDKSAFESFARDNELTLKVEQKTGAYIASGMLLVTIYYDKQLSNEICNQLRDAFLLGSERTSEQDVEYSIHQLVAIAVRALSPGINDPFTALACIDYLGSVVCRIANREFPSENSYNPQQQILVIYKTVTFAGIVSAAFDEIRRYSLDKAEILIRLLEVFHHSMTLCGDLEQKDVLLRHAHRVHKSGLENLLEESDKQALDSQYQKILDQQKS